MISKAVSKYLRISPQKARLVIALIKGKQVGDAMDILKGTNKKAARLIAKVLYSAVANAGRLPHVQEENLFISNIFADGGPMLKRFRAETMGRASQIKKRTSHITVELDLNETTPLQTAKEPKKAKAVKALPKVAPGKAKSEKTKRPSKKDKGTNKE